MSEEDYETYGETRRQVYPDTYWNAHPSEKAERDYARYSKRSDEANATMAAYKKDYKAFAGKAPVDTLSERQHRSLLKPAGKAATYTLSNAQARDSFLSEHPYGYGSGSDRKAHEHYADKAWNQASHYRDRYDTHHSGSTKGSSSAQTGGENPPYWQLDGVTGQYYHKHSDGSVSWLKHKD